MIHAVDFPCSVTFKIEPFERGFACTIWNNVSPSIRADLDKIDSLLNKVSLHQHCKYVLYTIIMMFEYVLVYGLIIFLLIFNDLSF